MSYSSSHHYETVYILKSGLNEADTTAIHQKVDNVISKFSGKLTHREDWGIRDLAYEINKERSGKYTIVNYTGNSGVVEEIERHFKISDAVVRFITVTVPANYDYQNVKKQIHAAEEEIKQARELRKKGP